MSTEPTIVAYTWVSKALPDAAELVGVSLRTLQRAVDQGDLIVHYAGQRNTKPIVRAVDLDAWVESLPTEPGRYARRA
jgi:Helix-turn-helix domain